MYISSRESRHTLQPPNEPPDIVHTSRCVRAILANVNG